MTRKRSLSSTRKTAFGTNCEGHPHPLSRFLASPRLVSSRLALSRLFSHFSRSRDVLGRNSPSYPIRPSRSRLAMSLPFSNFVAFSQTLQSATDCHRSSQNMNNHLRPRIVFSFPARRLPHSSPLVFPVVFKSRNDHHHTLDAPTPTRRGKWLRSIEREPREMKEPATPTAARRGGADARKPSPSTTTSKMRRRMLEQRGIATSALPIPRKVGQRAVRSSLLRVTSSLYHIPRVPAEACVGRRFFRPSSTEHHRTRTYRDTQL